MRAFRQPAAQVVAADTRNGIADPLDTLQSTVRAEEREQETEGHHSDPHSYELVGQVVENTNSATIGKTEVGDHAVLPGAGNDAKGRPPTGNLDRTRHSWRQLRSGNRVEK